LTAEFGPPHPEDPRCRGFYPHALDSLDASREAMIAVDKTARSGKATCRHVMFVALEQQPAPSSQNGPALRRRPASDRLYRIMLKALVQRVGDGVSRLEASSSSAGFSSPSATLHIRRAAVLRFII